MAGAINITAAGPITIDSPIEATTGRVLDGSRTAGNGGAIKFNSVDDAVAINSRMQASSADPAITTARRRSANGREYHAKSGKPSGVAINISNTGQLLSLLDAAAPGPGGKVTILATGAKQCCERKRKNRGAIAARSTFVTPATADRLSSEVRARATPLMRMPMSSKSLPWETMACSLSATACCRRTQP